MSVRDHIEVTQLAEKQLAELMSWHYLENQDKGDAIDYIAPNGKRIEIKFDWDSIMTGNHYLEFAQTVDGWNSTDPSGIALSEDKADYWVVVNEEFIRIFEMDTLVRWLKDNRTRFETRETRTGVNHNLPGQYSRGYIIPFVDIDNVVLLKSPSSIERPK